MSRIQKDREKRKERLGKGVRRRLILLIVFLSTIIAALQLRMVEELWPIWLFEFRSVVTGILLFTVVILVLLSPVIIESSKNPRALSGPGKNPYIDN